jgi:hypothetical protein
MFLYIGICGVWQYFFAVNTHTRIYIDRTSMSVTKTAFGRRRLVFQSSRDLLYKLTYVKRLYHPNSEGRIVEVPPELKIWARQVANYGANYPDISYRIGQSWTSDSETRVFRYLTAAELDWLAQELSNWLGLPLTRE